MTDALLYAPAAAAPAAARSCAHCGETLRGAPDSPFCCPGCASAHAIIGAAGLGSFYRRLEQTRAHRPEPLRRQQAHDLVGGGEAPQPLDRRHRHRQHDPGGTEMAGDLAGDLSGGAGGDPVVDDDRHPPEPPRPVTQRGQRRAERVRAGPLVAGRTVE